MCAFERNFYLYIYASKCSCTWVRTLEHNRNASSSVCPRVCIYKFTRMCVCTYFHNVYFVMSVHETLFVCILYIQNIC